MNMNTYVHGPLSAARPIAGMIRASALGVRRSSAHEERDRVVPFVTISREAGAGGWSLAERLAEHLNVVDPGEQPWTAWDRELVEKVAADHHISAAMIESMEDRGHTWFEEFLGGLKVVGHEPSEFEVYFRTATTIRALAEMGRTIIVGCGGRFITAAMPGGLHVRLIAPLEYRISCMARHLNISREAAAAKVRDVDHNRAAFYRRYWPGRPLVPEAFAMTLNTAAIDEARLVMCVAAVAVTSQPTSRIEAHERSC